MLSTRQLILFVILPTYLLVLSAGYLIARWNRGHTIMTLGVGPRVLAPLTEGFWALPALVGSLILLPLLPALALLSVPLFFVLARIQGHREAKFTEQMKGRGRVISWSDAQRHLAAGQGTLLHEMLSFHGPCRVWWTSDDVAAISPFPFHRSGNNERHLRDAEYRDFGKWCRQRYTSELSGSAVLVEQPRTKLERQTFWQTAAAAGYIHSYCVERTQESRESIRGTN